MNRHYLQNIKELYSQKKVQVYTELVLSLLTASFFLFFAIKPTAVTISGLMKKIKDQQLTAEKLQDKINALSQAKQEYLLIESSLPLVEQSLPQENQFSVLIKEIESLARRTNITVESIQFNKVALKEEKIEKPEEPKEIEFSFAASGSYQNLKFFLQSLDSLRRIISVQQFGFESGKTETEKLVLNLKGKAFYLLKEENRE